MKTKRFIATDMRTAMNRVRAEQGADAVILSQRQVAGGVELITSTHYPPAHRLAASAVAAKTKAKTPAAAALARASVGIIRRASPALAAPPSKAPKTLSVAAKNPSFSKALIQSHKNAALLATVPADDPPVVPAFGRQTDAPVIRPQKNDTAHLDTSNTPSLSPVLKETPSPELEQLRNEIAQMRRMMEAQMAYFTDQRLRGHPARNQALDWLEIHGFSPDSARQIAAELAADTDPDHIHPPLFDIISQQLPIATANPLQDGGIIALVGPSGAGKTTTAAKLAAQFLRQHSARDIALVSISVNNDNLHSSSLLHRFGRQLGVAVHEASNAPELGVLLKRLSDYRLLIIDSASPDSRQRLASSNSLQWFIRASAQVNTLLVLPATTGVQEMHDMLQRFSSHRPHAAVLTRLDETRRLGAALSVAIQQHLPLAWLSDGQNVLDSLYPATASVLIQRLKDVPVAADNADMAQCKNSAAENTSLAKTELRHAAA